MSQQDCNALLQAVENPPVAPAGVPGGATTPSVTEQWPQQMSDHHADRLNALEQELKKQIGAIQDLISYQSRLAHARALNASAKELASVLQPLPLPNGDNPPLGVFPETLGALRNLEGAALTELIRLYDLPHPDSEYEQFCTLASYFCIRP